MEPAPVPNGVLPMENSTQTVHVIVCSPRAGGNSDTMAQHIAQGVQEAGGQAQITYLRELKILPCIGCSACFSHPQNICVLERKDDVARIFSVFEGASPIILVAPIYFYHVPAQLKALMDRGQKYWAKRHNEQKKHGAEAQQHAGAWQNTVRIALVAARPRGENLFTGALLSLGLFWDVFQKNIGETSLWMGYDGAEAFAQDAQACARIQAFGAQAVT